MASERAVGTIPSRRDHVIGVALVVISACGFGSGALFAKPVYAAGLDWMTLLAWRFLIAAIASWLWLVAFPAHRAALRRLSRGRLLVLLLLGVFYVGNSGTYFAAIETVPASLAALIVYLYPALVAVLTLRYGRPLSGRRAWVALGLASAGVCLAVGGIAPGTAPPFFGLVLTFASPLIYAVWIVLAARLGGERSEAEHAATPASASTTGDGHETTDPAPATAVMTTATFAVFWLAATATGRPTSPADVPSDAWIGLLGVGLISTALAIQAFYAGWRRIGAANASLVSTVEPVYTIVLATLLFGEILTPVQVAGGALVIMGVILAQTGRTESPRVAQGRSRSAHPSLEPTRD